MTFFVILLAIVGIAIAAAIVCILVIASVQAEDEDYR